MKKLVFVASLMLLLGTLVSAQTSQQEYKHNLTVDEAVSLAVANNVSIKQSKINLKVLELKNEYSWNSVSPSFSLGTSFSGSADVKNENFFNNPSVSASASVRASFSPALFTSIEAARLAYESGQASYESTVRKIELSVRKSFYNLIYTKENIQLQEANLASGKQVYDNNKVKYNAGRLSELDLLTSQYNYEALIPAIDNMKNNYQISLDNFKQVLGLNLSEGIELVGSLEEEANVKVSDDVLLADINNLPDVKTVLRQIESGKNSLLATKYSAYGPSLTLSTSANLSTVIGKKSMTGPFGMSYSASISIPVDGYMPWSNGALSIENQKASLESLEIELENVKTSASIAIRNYYNAIIQAQRQLSLYKQNLDLVQRTYDMTKKAYNSGSASLSVLQTASDNLSKAKNNLQSQRYTIISSILDLENLLGVPFGTLAKKAE